MKKKMFCILTVLLAVFLVISAVPEGSAQIQDEENKDLKDEDKEVSPTQEETAEIPTLSIGDSWTYHQDLWSNKSGDEFVHTVEQITYTVSAIETYEYKGNSYYGYNLTLDGEVLDGEGSDGTVDFQINSGQVTGYLFLRMSDLGTVVDYQWRKMDGEAMGVEMTTWQETHVHENPVVETHDYPIRLGGNFYANTTKDSESYVKVVVGGQEMQNETTEENNTLYQETTVSSSIEQVSPPAGTFDTFELNRTISGDNEGYVQKNYAAAVKNTVKS
ncbi:MAG: hypothetical protein KGY76_09935, partial [Candidatus Thermoplasmatota archaeon]|nr:hypothetical protein [Candidatus Thermoplasmatota archaeon]